jgi:flagellar hook capping protein FlgD
MVDCNDNMAIGFSASNPAIYAGAYYATRFAGDPAGSIGGTASLALGVDFYNRRFGGARNRWGDYSGLSVDPVDEATFYVYNEYAGPRGTIIPSLPAEDGRWHTKLGWFRVKQVVSVAISKFDAVAKDGAVKIASEFRSDLGVQAVNLYRATGDGEFALIETVFDASTSFEFVDHGVVPGNTYRYQIGVYDGDGEFRSPIITVNMPAADSALSQNVPNPFNPTTLIRYELPEAEHVTLAVYDANGTLVRTLVDEVRPIGKNEITWDGRSDTGNAVGSGVYFYRIAAGSFSQSRKMVLLK